MVRMEQKQEVNVQIKPMRFPESLLMFGIPAALFAVAFYVLMPWLIRSGMNGYYASLLSLGIPLVLLGVAGVIGFKLEGGRGFKHMLARFRFKPIKGRQWLTIAIIFAAEMALFIGLQFANNALISGGIIPIPANLPEIADPLAGGGIAMIDRMVGGLKGNWAALFITAGVLAVNVVGEEMWWRGYVYPRQEKALGSKVWIVHGVMWALFHSYKYWDMLILLPVSLGLALAVYKTNNSSPGLIFHTLTNGTTLAAVFVAVVFGP